MHEAAGKHIGTVLEDPPDCQPTKFHEALRVGGGKQKTASPSTYTTGQQVRAEVPF
jgi:hypothetical protein